MTPTIKAPHESVAGSVVALGTIGFDLYLSALGVSRDALRAARVPKGQAK
jgi:hypothetical protein